MYVILIIHIYRMNEETFLTYFYYIAFSVSITVGDAPIYLTFFMDHTGLASMQFHY